MLKLIIYVLNTILILLSFTFSMTLAVEIILFFNGMRLDWQNRLYASILNPFVKRCSWTINPGERPSEEDPNVIETVWPNLMRACRDNPDKETKINIAFVNGSYTFGQGVRDQDTMIWKLNEKYPNVTFDNYAVPGYGPLQCGEHLKQHVFSTKDYDLVCYNINEGNLFVNAYPHAQHGNLGINNMYVIAPYSKKDIFGRWHDYNSFETEFVFNNRLLSSDLFYRLYLVRMGSYDYTAHHKDPKDKIRDRYVHQVQELESLCRSHNSDFAVCALEPNVQTDIFPNLNIESPKVDISFADIHETKYRVLQTPGFHPNALVHAHWAQRFSEWLDKEYLPKKSKP